MLYTTYKYLTNIVLFSNRKKNEECIRTTSGLGISILFIYPDLNI